MKKTLAVFFAALAFCVVQRDRALCGDGAYVMQGVYFMPVHWENPLFGRHRIIEFRNGSFRSSISYGRRKEVPVEIKGRCSSHNNTMTLEYHDGEKLVRLSNTYAVVNGHLWLGVFVKGKGPKGEPQWACHTERLSFFSHSDHRAPQGWVRWNIEKGTWELLPTDPQTGRKVEFSGLSTLPLPDKREDVEAFTAVFPDNDTLRSVSSAIGWLRYGDVDFGVALPEDAELAEMGKRYGDRLFRARYVRKGDVIIAPWSIDLGPAGLVPKIVEAEAVEGEWVNESDSTDVVKLRKPAAKDGRARIGPAFLPLYGPQGAKALAKALREAEFRSDENGISHSTWGWDCHMGHGDAPFHIYWLALKDGRMARYVSSGGCGNSTPARGVEFFRKMDDGKPERSKQAREDGNGQSAWRIERGSAKDVVVLSGPGTWGAGIVEEGVRVWHAVRLPGTTQAIVTVQSGHAYWVEFETLSGQPRADVLPGFANKRRVMGAVRGLHCVAVSHDAQLVAMGDWSGNVYVWELARTETANRLLKQEKEAEKKALAEQLHERKLAHVMKRTPLALMSVLKPGAFHIWSEQAARWERIPGAHRGYVTDVQFSEDSDLVMSGDSNGLFCALDVGRKEMKCRWRAVASIIGLEFHGNGIDIRTAADRVWRWSPQDAEPRLLDETAEPDAPAKMDAPRN
jgi:hypothetical protein